MKRQRNKGKQQPRAKDGKWTERTTRQPELPAVDVALSQQLVPLKSRVSGADEWPGDGEAAMASVARRLQHETVPGFEAAAEAAAKLPSALSMTERVQALVNSGISTQAAVAAAVRL